MLADFLLLPVLFYVVLYPLRLEAQDPCPFVASDAIVDTLEWRDYYPLKVGNTWEYIVSDGAFVEGAVRDSIVADTLIDNTLFYKIESEHYESHSGDELRTQYMDYNYITLENGDIKEWVNDEVNEHGIALGAHFDTCYTAGQGLGTIVVTGEYDAVYTLREQEQERNLHLAAVKQFESAFRAERYGHGIGLLIRVEDPSVRSELSYARVDDEVFGTPLESLFIVSVEHAATPSKMAAEMHAYPNPFRDAVRISFSQTEAVELTVSIIDIHGRCIAELVHNKLLSAGTYSVVWDSRNAPSGVYIARITSNGNESASILLTHIK